MAVMDALSLNGKYIQKNTDLYILSNTDLYIL